MTVKEEELTHREHADFMQTKRVATELEQREVCCAIHLHLLGIRAQEGCGVA
jgi:hypothetical protein